MVHLDQHLSFGKYHYRVAFLLLYSQSSSLGPMYFMSYASLKPTIRLASTFFLSQLSFLIDCYDCIPFILL